MVRLLLPPADAGTPVSVKVTLSLLPWSFVSLAGERASVTGGGDQKTVFVPDASPGSRTPLDGLLSSQTVRVSVPGAAAVHVIPPVTLPFTSVAAGVAATGFAPVTLYLSAPAASMP